MSSPNMKVSTQVSKVLSILEAKKSKKAASFLAYVNTISPADITTIVTLENGQEWLWEKIIWEYFEQQATEAQRAAFMEAVHKDASMKLYWTARNNIDEMVNVIHAEASHLRTLSDSDVSILEVICAKDHLPSFIAYDELASVTDNVQWREMITDTVFPEKRARRIAEYAYGKYPQLWDLQPCSNDHYGLALINIADVQTRFQILASHISRCAPDFEHFNLVVPDVIQNFFQTTSIIDFHMGVIEKFLDTVGTSVALIILYYSIASWKFTPELVHQCLKHWRGQDTRWEVFIDIVMFCHEHHLIEIIDLMMNRLEELPGKTYSRGMFLHSMIVKKPRVIRRLIENDAEHLKLVRYSHETFDHAATDFGQTVVGLMMRLDDPSLLRVIRYIHGDESVIFTRLVIEMFLRQAVVTRTDAITDRFQYVQTISPNILGWLISSLTPFRFLRTVGCFIPKSFIETDILPKLQTAGERELARSLAMRCGHGDVGSGGSDESESMESRLKEMERIFSLGRRFRHFKMNDRRGIVDFWMHSYIADRFAHVETGDVVARSDEDIQLEIDDVEDWLNNRKHVNDYVMYFSGPSTHGRHANAILLDRVRKVIMLFEPHGHRTSVDDGVAFRDKMIKALVKLTHFRFEPLEQTCPMYGPQTFAESLGPSREEDETGFCQIWSLLFVHLYIMFPEWSTQQVQQYMMQGTPDDSLNRAKGFAAHITARYISHNRK